jgi:hypothetical protein
MQRIALLEPPTEPARQSPADRRLPRAGVAHDDGDARGLPDLLQNG